MFQVVTCLPSCEMGTYYKKESSPSSASTNDEDDEPGSTYECAPCPLGRPFTVVGATSPSQCMPFGTSLYLTNAEDRVSAYSPSSDGYVSVVEESSSSDSADDAADEQEQEGAGTGLSGPVSLAFLTSDVFVVAEHVNGRIVAYDVQGKRLGGGAAGGGSGGFLSVPGVTSVLVSSPSSSTVGGGQTNSRQRLLIAAGDQIPYVKSYLLANVLTYDTFTGEPIFFADADAGGEPEEEIADFVSEYLGDETLEQDQEGGEEGGVVRRDDFAIALDFATTTGTGGGGDDNTEDDGDSALLIAVCYSGAVKRICASEACALKYSSYQETPTPTPPTSTKILIKPDDDDDGTTTTPLLDDSVGARVPRFSGIAVVPERELYLLLCGATKTVYVHEWTND